MNPLDKVTRKLISKGAVLKFVYEAGPCGYAIYRYLNNNDMDCVVIAPSKTPAQGGDRLKNDKGFLLARDSVNHIRSLSDFSDQYVILTKLSYNTTCLT
jgi:hypothetical protein